MEAGASCVASTLRRRKVVNKALHLAAQALALAVNKAPLKAPDAHNWYHNFPLP